MAADLFFIAGDRLKSLQLLIIHFISAAYRNAFHSTHIKRTSQIVCLFLEDKKAPPTVFFRVLHSFSFAHKANEGAYTASRRALYTSTPKPLCRKIQGCSTTIKQDQLRPRRFRGKLRNYCGCLSKSTPPPPQGTPKCWRCLYKE